MSNVKNDNPKPKMIVGNPYWDYFQVIDYIEKKYEISVRDYANKFKHNLDFWHWLCDNDVTDSNNGSFFYLQVDRFLKERETPKWVKEILQLIKDEFNVPEMKMWVCW